MMGGIGEQQTHYPGIGSLTWLRLSTKDSTKKKTPSPSSHSPEWKTGQELLPRLTDWGAGCGLGSQQGEPKLRPTDVHIPRLTSKQR